MSRSQSVVISLPDGQRLADLFGIGQDLTACLDCIQLYRQLATQKMSRTAHQLMDCVITTLVIRYGRCFGNSARRATSKELKARLESEDVKIHKLISALRDKHYAHSENSCEQPAIQVALTVGSAERKATGVSVGAHYVTGADPVLLQNVSLLVRKLLTWVVEEQKKESERLLPIVMSKYPLEELYSRLGKTKRHVVTFDDLSKKRKGT